MDSPADIISDIRAGLNLFKTDKRFSKAYKIMDMAKVNMADSKILRGSLTASVPLC